ncbi:MAG: SRPBCC family protein [Streptosporangiaceae bacterium]|nr:SRPBCC family protein [Streptosporangiaceae bacterium]
MADTNLQLTKVPDVNTGVLIRRPVDQVFKALTDPSITAKFWFTKSTGPLKTGAEVEWTWEMYNVSVPVVVKDFEKNRLVKFEWGPAPGATTVEFRFDARSGDTTYLAIKESGFTGGNGDEIVARVADSMGGFTQLIAALKAYLEHDIILTIVADRFPDGHG